MNNTAPWPQEIVVKPMEEIIITNKTSPNNSNSTAKPQPSTSLERKVRPQKEQAINCPRCNSTNTKFCYYNNYSLTQPRYFCKTCRRYWTEGGSLRNIPVGGGSRKNKRPASSAFSPSNTSSKIRLPDLVAPPTMITCNNNNNNNNTTNPNSKIHEQHGQDLNLGFPSTLSEFMHLPSMNTSNASTTTASSHLSALELLTGLTTSSRGLNMTPFMMPMHIQHDPNSVFPSGFTLQGDLKPALNFSLDGLGSCGGGIQENGGGIGGRILFPFEDLKSTITTATATTTSTADDHHHHQNHNHNGDHQQITRDQQGDSTGYWTGILGGAGSW